MTIARAVHWHEGMFLRPHHFQIAQRNWGEVAGRGDKWDLHYNWGLRSIDLDLDALANSRLVISSLQARLRDGTLVSVPEDGSLDPVEDELREALEGRSTVDVYLAIPNLHLGRANIQGPDNRDQARYSIEVQELEDENTGINPQQIPVRRLNVKLLLSTQDTAGFEVIPIGRIERSEQAEGTPKLNQRYFPPMLACDAWGPLQKNIINNIYDRIGVKMTLLAELITARGINFDSQDQGNPHLLAQLRQLNEAYPVLAMLSRAQGVHPFAIYVELSRLVGQLAIFSNERRVPDLPAYDHDNLGECFYDLKKYIDAFLDIMVEPEYKERPFIGAGLRMQVTLEPSWLEPRWDLFLGVKSDLPPERCVALLTQAGRLDMKIGSAGRVDTIFSRGHLGLNPKPISTAPAVLPKLADLIYFRVRPEDNPNEWDHVREEQSIAIRLNEQLIASDIQGQQTLYIRNDAMTTKMEFILFVTRREAR
ncbi:MAG: type VI secretion system baseplate subunit TssK [Gemmataceae bacterium]